MEKSRLDGKNKLFVVMSFLAFVVYAFYFNTFGTDAPLMMAFYDITSAQQGFILTMQSVGGFACAVFLALRGEQYNKIYVIAGGTAVLAAACLLIGLTPGYAALILLVVCAGIGFTCIDVMMNGVISEVYPRNKNTLLPVTHAFYGSGAMIAPLFVTLVVNPGLASTFGTPFLLIGVAAVLVAVLYFFSGKGILPHTPYAHMDSMKKRAAENPAEIFRTKTAWMFLAAGILYFSFQIGIASWLPTYCIENAGIPFNEAGMMLTAFFGGALIMRFAGALLLKKMSAKTLFTAFGFAAAIVMAAALFTENTVLMTVLIVASGFMQGSSVVALVILCCDAFPHRTASASAIAVISVNVGSLTAPLWMGALAEITGFRIPLLIGCAMLALASVLVILNRPPQKSPAA